MPYQKLFDYLSKELGITPFVSQMQEIVDIAVETHQEVQQVEFQEQTMAAVGLAEDYAYDEEADDEWLAYLEEEDEGEPQGTQCMNCGKVHAHVLVDLCCDRCAGPLDYIYQ